MFEEQGWQTPPASAFRARWNSGPARFAPWGGSDDDPAVPAAVPSGPGESSPNVWDEAFAAGHAAALAECAIEAQAIERLARALERLQPMPPAELADALAMQVRGLLRRLIGAAAVDEALLAERCAALAELATSSGEAVLHAHPDDASLLAAAGSALAVMADPALPRGELRLVDGPAEFAAGPHTMLDQWDADAGGTPC